MSDLTSNNLNDPLNRFLGSFTGIGARPGDSDELRLQKSLLTAGSLMILPATLIWGVLFLVYNEPAAGVITLVYATLTVLGLLYLATTGRHGLFALVQLACTLILPFVLTLVLGGFTGSSIVILGALMAPLGALLYANSRHAMAWFGAYLALLALAGLLEPLVRRTNNLPFWLITVLFVLNIAMVSALAFLMLNSFVRQKDRALALLRVEQSKSERLLLNVLPRKIAALLKNEDQGQIAERFDAVSVLFADVVHFTELSAVMDPAEMVGLLNEVFSYFDSLVDKYGLEKIRTIGDNYMVASGVPTARADHAQALARMALEMLEYVRHHPGRQAKLQFRIGMNTGPVVAGIIGQQKFHYDIWGDSVNVASRMETQGEPGKIQITGAMHQLLQDQFICEPRGCIEIKGKGEMETWFLMGVKTAGG
jgi:adenylate cyclase